MLKAIYLHCTIQKCSTSNSSKFLDLPQKITECTDKQCIYCKCNVNISVTDFSIKYKMYISNIFYFFIF